MGKKTEDEMDAVTLMKIGAEIEFKFWDKIQTKFNHRNFIFDKKLDSLFDKVEIQQLRN